MGKSKRNSGPKQDSNRAAKLAQREAERASLESGTTRPFEGLAAECDLVALREFVPSATATAPITSGGRTVTLANEDTLPIAGGVPIIVDGEIIGAIGVSGAAAAEDNEIALATLEPY